ncbi:MAG: ubiquinol-cytochrome c reductase iron-sulfur subunit [Vicinamibacterales bacterium]
MLLVNGAVATIGGALSALLGVFALKPPSAASGDRWIRAGALSDLEPAVPSVRVLVVPRVDGWYRARAPQTVFLVWDGKKEVRAVSATCTHLGCQVHWDAKDTKFRCPCHGGVYAASGAVLEGPPPRPLDSLDARIDTADDTVLVRL